MLGLLHKSGAPIGVGSKASFDEVVLRSAGRYDVPYEYSEFESKDLAAFENIADAMLEGDCEPAFCGVVRSESGSTAQEWHIDSLHMSAPSRGD